MKSQILYILAIVAANVVTASTAPMVIGELIVPYGTLLIGLTLVLRDMVQRELGRKKAYETIAAALVISAVTSYVLGDPLAIVFASAVTFALSETVDTEIFARMVGSFYKKSWYSGIGGGFIDSAVFVVIGLSPIGAGFLTWEQVIPAIAGQFIVKLAIQGLTITGLKATKYA